MPPPYAAYLRVYEPLAAFDRDEQLYWRRYVKDGRAVPTSAGPARQRELMTAALGAGWFRLPAGDDDAYVLEAEDTLLVCPWNLRVRAAEAALEARDGVPPVIADAFIPPALAEEAEAVLAEWRAPGGSLEDAPPRLHEQVSTWAVPVRWFVFVDAGERDLRLDGGQRMLRYRTPISLARRRGHRALAVLRRTLPDGPVTASLDEASRWLEEFHPRSVVELDYGGLAELLPADRLRADNSPELAAKGLAALSRGDAAAAGAAYEELTELWRATQLLERSN